MLKIILSVAGVLCIGLGLFGGNVLEGFTGNKASERGLQVQMPKIEVPAVAEASISTNVADPQAPQVVGMADTKGQPANDQLVEQVAVVTPEATTEGAVVAVAVASDISSDGAEPMAPAKAAGDLIAMAEQAKSSSRNQQVDMAKAVLESNASQPLVATASGAVDIIDKNAEVETAIKTTTGDIGKDVLIVIKDKVNLRDGPSISHSIVLTLEHGQELMEFKRDGNWVHVGAYGTSGKIGWVHQRLVGPVAR